MKKFVAMFLSLVMMLSFIPHCIMATANAVEADDVTDTPIYTSKVKGDVNGDYTVSNADLILIARYIVLLESDLPVMSNGDLNRDGIITNSDLIETAIIIVSEPDIDFTALYESLDESTPVMSIGDVEINWGTMYYYFYHEVTKLTNRIGEIYDWTAEYQYGETYLEYCLSEAVYNNLRYIAGVEHFAKKYNVTLTEDQIKKIEEDRLRDIELFGDEEARLQYLTSVYLTENTARYLAEIDYLYVNTMEAMYGANGEKLTVEEITELADTAYKMAKVVAIPKDQPNALANAEAALAAVKAAPAAEREAKFDELIDKYCEAEKAEELKGGYVYTRGKFFDKAAEDAVKELEKNQYHDGVIEGKDYYFVAMRLPVDVDAHPYAYPYYQYNPVIDENNPWGDYTLRQLYVDDIYEQTFWEWADYVEVVYYDNLVNILKITNS